MGFLAEGSGLRPVPLPQSPGNPCGLLPGAFLCGCAPGTEVSVKALERSRGFPVMGGLTFQSMFLLNHGVTD